MAGNAEFNEAIDYLNKARVEHGVEVKGSMYSMVKDRIETFRRMWGDRYGINTDIHIHEGFLRECVVVIKATISNEDRVLASGMAMERIQGIEENEMSWNACVEATETKAIGRALACFGLHGGEYSSDAEMIPVAQRQANTGGYSDPKPDGYQAPVDNFVQEKPKAEPPVTSEGVPMFVPSWSDIQNKGIDQLMGPVLTTLDQIEDMNSLTQYWSALEEFRNTLPDNFFQELKDFFKKATNEIGAKNVSQ